MVKEISYTDSVLSIIKMIFEFLKSFFWKADSDFRKRKASEVVTTTDYNALPKRHRYDFRLNTNTISNRVIESANLGQPCNEFKSSSLRVDEPDLNFTNYRVKQPTTKINRKDPVSRNLYIEKPAYTMAFDNFNESTLFNTHRLQEKQKYKEMLQNHVMSDTPRSNLSRNDSDKKLSNYSLRNSRDNSSSDAYPYYSTQLFNNYSLRSHDLFNRSRGKTSDTFNKSPDISVIKQQIQDEKMQENTEQNKPNLHKIEILQTNTLKEKLSSKEVLKKDYLNHINKKYTQRFDECTKQAKEIEKMTTILAKQNRLTREAALEEQLMRSMRLCEAIIDDQYEEEFVLPELTGDMIKYIHTTLKKHNSNDVLVEKFGLRIAKKDLETLGGLNWLNDEVINFYMNLLIERSTKDNYPSIYAMNTFFYPKLLKEGPASIRRWTRKIDIFSKDIIIVPVHLGIHWCMSAIDFRDKSIKYYDSMGSKNQQCLLALKDYLEYEHMDKKKTAFSTNDWNLNCVRDIPQQMNGSDCGVFSCVFAEFICSNRDFKFSQQDMPYFRKKISYEILSAKLL